MNKLDFRLIGGILLIVGTSIGGGMLALPLSNAPMGFFYSTGLLILCWLVMVLAAFAILEVNLWFPSGSNLISMIHGTLGKSGRVIGWFVYLFLLYALLSAYISGGSDIFQSLLNQISLFIPSSISSLLFVLIFGGIVYSGIRTVDYANRALMFGKLGVCFLLLLLIFPQIHFSNLTTGDWHQASSSVLILIVSFGFATIIPSLRTYFHDDVRKLRRAIVWGSLIPLIIYISWDAVIMGVIPIDGEQGLLALLHSNHSTSDLTTSLTAITQNTWISHFFSFFTSICMLTAFLGVSLGLFDFLSDGLKIEKKGKNGFIIVMLAYLPPLLLVLFYPGIFIIALNYAGLLAVILLLLIPALMLGVGRYIKRLPEKVSLPLIIQMDNTSNKYWPYETEHLKQQSTENFIQKENISVCYSIKKGKTTVAILLLISFFLIYLAIPT